MAPRCGRNNDGATKHNSGSSTYKLAGMNKTPAGRVGGNPSQLIGRKVAGCNPAGHKIGEVRKK